ncbi:MAG TPA: 4'-phosphopantetheinyl transferase superfamily protein [Pilimelia sp.]|nr:4'-phosphopantetheinyl transferase superfamily protein [Pilimelia sp.]
MALPDVLVPELAADECQVWWARATDARPALADLLEPAERERMGALRHHRARTLYLVAHALARLVAAAALDTDPATLRFTARCRRCGGPHGKPTLVGADQPRLSLSHSGGLAVVALTRAVEVGVDVERITLAGRRIPVTALAAAERAALDTVPGPARLRGFIRYWTRKEAVLKATGDGLAVGPATVSVSPPTRPPALLSWPGRSGPPIHLHDLADRPGHLACVAMLGRRLHVTEYDASRLLASHVTKSGHQSMAGRRVAATVAN